MEIVTIEKNKLVGEIQDILTAWLNEKTEVRTVASLSRATGVTDPAIRRLKNNNVKINDDAIFKLLAHIFEVQTFDGISAALEKHPDTLKWFERNFSYLKKSPNLQAYKISNISDLISQNVISLAIFSLVSSKNNLRQSYIKEQFGVIGEFELEKLITEKVIAVNANGELRVEDKKIILSKDQVASLLPDLAKMFFKAEHKYNGRILNIESVSIQGYNKLLDAVDAFNEQVRAITNENYGEIPVVTAGFLDTLTTVPYFEGGKNETSN